MNYTLKRAVISVMAIAALPFAVQADTGTGIQTACIRAAYDAVFMGGENATNKGGYYANGQGYWTNVSVASLAAQPQWVVITMRNYSIDYTKPTPVTSTKERNLNVWRNAENAPFTGAMFDVTALTNEQVQSLCIAGLNMPQPPFNGRAY